MDLLKNKRILLCVTGGIAAYKSAELCRTFQKEGATVRVALTEAASHFITPLTFQALSGLEVMVDLFDQRQEHQISHIAATRDVDAVVVAPATANILGKMANGLADDLVSTLLLACRKPVILAPSMNWAMYQNPATQRNIDILKEFPHVQFVDPEEGDLACGEQGTGRMAELPRILDRVFYACREEKDLDDEAVLITAGPTVEMIDPVRYLSNRSSGKMGFSLAREAKARGAKVILVTGPTLLANPEGVETIRVRSAKEMADVVKERAKDVQIIIKSAAVADYTPERVSPQKIKKSNKDLTLNLKKTTDILYELGKSKRHGQYLVGFAAETQQVLQNARQKLRDKQADMIVMNDVSKPGAGFDSETNEVHLVDSKGHVDTFPMLPKMEVAHRILDAIQERRASRSSSSSRRKPAHPARRPRTRRSSTPRSEERTTPASTNNAMQVKAAEAAPVESNQASPPESPATKESTSTTPAKRSTRSSSRKRPTPARKATAQAKPASSGDDKASTETKPAAEEKKATTGMIVKAQPPKEERAEKQEPTPAPEAKAPAPAEPKSSASAAEGGQAE